MSRPCTGGGLVELGGLSAPCATVNDCAPLTPLMRHTYLPSGAEGGVSCVSKELIPWLVDMPDRFSARLQPGTSGDRSFSNPGPAAIEASRVPPPLSSPCLTCQLLRLPRRTRVLLWLARSTGHPKSNLGGPCGGMHACPYDQPAHRRTPLCRGTAYLCQSYQPDGTRRPAVGGCGAPRYRMQRRRGRGAGAHRRPEHSVRV